jgi:16S rRNA (adenine1518-N6/adenine1519-N6)-dimethyltransferase
MKLKDERVLQKIAMLACERKPDAIIEIGGGHGELTRHLIEEKGSAQLIVIEKDPGLGAKLITNYESEGVRIKDGDVRNILQETTKDVGRYVIAGNIPYYLSGSLFRMLGELEQKPERIVLLVQKEVADRAASLPPDMNKLAASIQLWAKVETKGFVGKKSFMPAPKVDSEILMIEPKENPSSIKEGVLQILFAQPRKTVANNLFQKTKDRKMAEDMLEKAGVTPTARPQNLSIEQIVSLASQLSP